jgi:hypothetical protein
MTKTIDVVDSALDYCAKNWFVLPVKANSKEPVTRLVCNGFKSASNNPEVVSDWFNSESGMNVGIACEMSGLLVIDIDYRNMTPDSWTLAKQVFQETMMVETGDGVHLYFKADGLSDVKGKLDAGIDIKYKGYVVAAPSIHSNGKQYEANGLEPVVLPDYLKEWVTK